MLENEIWYTCDCPLVNPFLPFASYGVALPSVGEPLLRDLFTLGFIGVSKAALRLPFVDGTRGVYGVESSLWFTSASFHEMSPIVRTYQRHPRLSHQQFAGLHVPPSSPHFARAPCLVNHAPASPECPF